MSRAPTAMPPTALRAPAKPSRAAPAPAPRTREKSAAGLASTMAALNVVMTEDRQEIKPRKASAKPKAKTREGKKGLVLYLDPAVPASLRRLAALLGRDVQSLGQEALALLFAKYETPPAPARKPRAAASRAKGA